MYDIKKNKIVSKDDFGVISSGGVNIKLSDFYNYKNHINSDISNEYFENFVNNILNDNHHILVIECDNIIIGSGTLLIEEKMTTGENYSIEHLQNGFYLIHITCNRTEYIFKTSLQK